MKEYEIHLSDWARIFTGDVPPAFYGELVFRAVYLFLLLILCMRVLGKRMAAQLSRNDLAAMVSLAAAIGVPFVASDRGIIPSTIIAIIVVSITRLSAVMNFKNKKIEQVTIGDVSAMVEDGIMNITNMRKSRLPRERVMAQVRSQQMVHLGEVKRLYMESTGDFSLVKSAEPKPGLLALPAGDKEFVNEMVEYSDIDICLECGYEKESANKCRKCGSTTFTKAVNSKN
jgi:uncharacterized membrane protein YcaP (DUF421 family)